MKVKTRFNIGDLAYMFICRELRELKIVNISVFCDAIHTKVTYTVKYNKRIMLDVSDGQLFSSKEDFLDCIKKL